MAAVNLTLGGQLRPGRLAEKQLYLQVLDPVSYCRWGQAQLFRRLLETVNHNACPNWIDPGGTGPAYGNCQEQYFTSGEWPGKIQLGFAEKIRYGLRL